MSLFTKANTHNEDRFKRVKDMPTHLIQELEIYFQIDTSGVQRCLDEGYSVAEIKQLCRDIHNCKILH